MRKKSDKESVESVDLVDAPVFTQCGDHTHFAGTMTGTLRRPSPESEGEVVYEGKGSVGGGSKVYADNYETMDWGDSKETN